MNNRDSRLDFLRAAAIILVVVGHYLQCLPVSEEHPLFRLIYAFHMPLFMFIAGLAAAHSSAFSMDGVTVQTSPWLGLQAMPMKAARLLIPFLSWGVVRYFAMDWHTRAGFSEYIQTLFERPDIGLWFLPVLFCIFAVLSVVRVLYGLALRRYGHHAGLTVFASLCCGWLLLVLMRHNYACYLSCYYYPFVCAGLFWNRVSLPVAGWTPVFALAGFALLFPFWHRTEADAQLLQWFGASHELMIKAGVAAFVGVCGSAIFVALMNFSHDRCGASLRMLMQRIGCHTLAIYAIHLYALDWSRNPVIVPAAIAISMAGDWLLRQSRWTQLLMLGEPCVRLRPLFSIGRVAPQG